MKYFAKISYVGTGFCGFQYQSGLRTVQGELTRICEELFGCRCDVTGCSRTDSGVHAREFCITAEPKSDRFNRIPPESLPAAAEYLMPGDMSMFYAAYADDDFHPRYSALGKEYVYEAYCSDVKNPFFENRAWHIKQNITDAGIERMNRAAEYITGTHDFSSFMSSGSKITDAVRTVKNLRIYRDGEKILFVISADGFLYNMVRIIVGTLKDVACGKIEPEEIVKIIESGDRANAGATAPACGLYLNRVFYR